VSGDANGRVVIWDPGSGETILSFELSDSVTQVAWSPDGRRLLAKQASGELTVWDSAPGIEKVQSSVVSDMLAERIVKAALLAERNAYMFFDEGEYELAFKQLESWMKESASEYAREGGQFRLPKSAVFAYYLARGFWAVQQERIDDAADDFRSAALTGQDDLQAITQLAELIAKGAEVEDFDRVATIAFEPQTKRNDIYRETIAVTAIASVAEEFRTRLANNLNEQASILRTAGTSINDVIKVREQALECLPEDADLLHQLADDYYVAGDFQKAILLQQRAIALRPEWDEAQTRLRNYERAMQ
jgi:tetratricopeptide (TPR) repeat protein